MQIETKPDFLMNIIIGVQYCKVKANIKNILGFTLLYIDRVPYFHILLYTTFSLILQIWLLLWFQDTLSPFWSQIQLLPT